jgi:hypothetical protein
MKFQPKTEKELQEQSLWLPGEYDFEVVKAERAISSDKSKTPGTPFIKLNLRVYANDGRYRFVNAILHPAMEFQLRHFCETAKLMAKYEAGELDAEDCENVAGRLKLKVTPERNGYPAKNEVADYIVAKVEVHSESAAAAANPAADDDVPF